MNKISKKEYAGFIVELKQSIIRSRFQAARLANREQLLLYLFVGKQLSDNIKANKWGAKVLQQISIDLQHELPGLRGFSETNLKRMRQFSDEYFKILIRPSVTAQFEGMFGKGIKKAIRPSVTAQLKKPENKGVLSEPWLNAFLGISFTHHMLLQNKCSDKQERFFYMQKAAEEMWSVSLLEHQIASKAYKYKGKLPNNFKTTLPAPMRASALNVFKDEYLFDFMSLDDTESEREFEDAIIANIRNFIMRLGKGFSFIGNQYKVWVGERDYSVDLLFYNRVLQCLVAFDTKRGRFKPEHAGKMNFYLNVLDDKVKLPHEKPSIGVILCKEKDIAEVEYSFKNINKAMGVATYKISKEIPKEMRGILPDADELRKLLE